MVGRPGCGGGVTTNRSSSYFLHAPHALVHVADRLLFPTACRVPDVRMTRARDSVLADLHATRDVSDAAPSWCIIRVLLVWTELTRKASRRQPRRERPVLLPHTISRCVVEQLRNPRVFLTQSLQRGCNPSTIAKRAIA